MKKYITLNDIVIKIEYIEEDNRNAGYNIGDLLNMPHLNNDWVSCPHVNKGQLDRMNLIGNKYTNSILYYYCSHRENEENVPNISRIVDSVETYKTNNKDTLKNMIDIVKDSKTLCVHVRNGDLHTEPDFIKLIINISHKVDKIIILSGIHLDNQYVSEKNKKQNFMNTMNVLLKKENVYIYLADPDVHLSLMSEASNLLLHKGGFSCLGSILSTGKLYITKYFTYSTKSNWIDKVNKKYIFLNC